MSIASCRMRMGVCSPGIYSSFWAAAIVVGSLVACSHDARRANPLDAELTPAVSVHSAASDSAGTVALSWTPYDGQIPFAAYWVLRNRPLTTVVDTLARVQDAGITSFVDTVAQGSEFVYRVSVINASGLEVCSNEARTRPLTLPDVIIESLEFESISASARITWSPYPGPRFQSYEVRRRSAELAPQVIHAGSDVAATEFVDSGLRGNTEYFYEVAVRTGLGETIVSDERSGRFHALVGSWPLAMPDKAAVRLYANHEGEIEALVSTKQLVQLYTFSATGTADTQVLLEMPHLLGGDEVIMGFADLRGAALGIGENGQHLLVTSSPRLLAGQVSNRWGQPTYRPGITFEAPLPTDFDSSGPVTLGGWIRVALHHFLVDNVRITAGDGVVVDADLADGIPPDWTVRSVSATNTLRMVTPAWLPLSEGAIVITSLGTILGIPEVRIGDADLQPSAVELDLWFSESGVAGVTLADGRIRLDLNAGEGGSRLWIGGHTEVLDYGILPYVWYRIRVELTDNHMSLVVMEPEGWSEAQPTTGRLSVSRTGELYAQSIGEIRQVMMGDQILGQSDGHPAVSEMRTWRIDDTEHLALCEPDLNRIIIGRLSVSSFSGLVTWPRLGARASYVLGIGAGQSDGQMVFPVSMDRSLDGRHYVLDAGNGRIQVFGPSGQYLTQFRNEDGDAFDFGAGNVSTDFAGSVAVDGDGYIYVADVGNSRIRKFAP
jgi:hypothetical protein